MDGYLENYGASPNDMSTLARAANLAAFNAAMAEFRTVVIPQKRFYLPNNARIVVPGGRTIGGSGEFDGVSEVVGNGDIFIFSNASGRERRRFEGFSIRNETPTGTLIKIDTTDNMTSMFWQRMTFGPAVQHLYAAGGQAIHWVLRECEFQHATVRSRFIDGAYNYIETACYTKENKQGIRFGDHNVEITGIKLTEAIFEHHDESAIAVVVEGANAYSIVIDAHFEANGKTAGAADIVLQTNTNHKIQSVDLGSTRFIPHATGTQTEHISMSEHTAGNIGKIRIGHAFHHAADGIPLASAANIGKILSHAWVQ